MDTSIDFEKAVTWCEQRTGKTLAPRQREAVRIVLANRVVIITGGPGVGKTTLANSILMVWSVTWASFLRSDQARRSKALGRRCPSAHSAGGREWRFSRQRLGAGRGDVPRRLG
jgi:MoxR-like ATPase